MDLKQIEELLELEKKATKGEWYLAGGGRSVMKPHIDSEHGIITFLSIDDWDEHESIEDIKFMLAARNMVRPIGEYIKRQDKALKLSQAALRSLIESLYKHMNHEEILEIEEILRTSVFSHILRRNP